jgi:hypothetical protein
VRRWLCLALGLAACKFDPPADVGFDARMHDARAIDAAIHDGPPEPIDGPDGASLTASNIPARILVGDIVPVSFTVGGDASTTIDWAITSGGGSFAPMSSTVATNGSGVGVINGMYTAPGTAGDLAHSMSLDGGAAQPFDTLVRDPVEYGYFDPSADNASLLVASNRLIGTLISIPTDQYVMRLGFHTVTGGYTARMAVYRNNGGNPGALVASTAPFAAVDGENEQDVIPTLLTAGTYWLLGNFELNASIKRDSGAGNINIFSIAHSISSPLPDPPASPMFVSNLPLDYYLVTAP